MLKKIVFDVEGIHCKSCKILIETELDVLRGVKDVKVDYQTGKCEIEYDDRKVSLKQIKSEIEKLDYKIASDAGRPQKKSTLLGKLFTAGCLIIISSAVYLAIVKLGLFEVFAKLNEQNIGLGLIFLIGILAGFHCIGMCGGLVVAYTASDQKKGRQNHLSHWQYNLGRLISYTVIGGILGGFGSFFGINPTFTGTVTLLAGFFMILMGASLISKNKILDKIKLRTPAFIARFLYNQKHGRKPKGPFIIGLLNGFMPCGPLQAMQLYALTTSSVIMGALSMGVYSLGTIPIMFGFGSFISYLSRDRIMQIMKFSGVLVMVLGLFMINRGLVNFGYGYRGFVNAPVNSQIYTISEDQQFQTVTMDLTYQGYQPNVMYIQQGVPVRWVINVKQMTGCTDEIILAEFDIRKELAYGENIIEFLPTELGEIRFSCWMKMVWGKFIVINQDADQNASDTINQDDTSMPLESCPLSGCPDSIIN